MEVPRRNQMLAWTPAEKAIQDTVGAVEAMGADPRLTDAVVLLGMARDRVADFVDGVKEGVRIVRDTEELRKRWRSEKRPATLAEIEAVATALKAFDALARDTDGTMPEVYARHLATLYHACDPRAARQEPDMTDPAVRAVSHIVVRAAKAYNGGGVWLGGNRYAQEIVDTVRAVSAAPTEPEVEALDAIWMRHHEAVVAESAAPLNKRPPVGEIVRQHLRAAVYETLAAASEIDVQKRDDIFTGLWAGYVGPHGADPDECPTYYDGCCCPPVPQADFVAVLEAVVREADAAGEISPATFYEARVILAALRREAP